jgi:DNA-binding NarL/FixJ family response regulator
MTKPELEKILQNANFTQDEESVFWLLARGKTITEISQLENVSERTVNRKIKDIRIKVSRLE